MPSAPAYMLGMLELCVAVGGAALGATRVRARLLPGWSGPPSWVVDGVFTIALLIWVAEALGSFGLLSAIPFAALSAGVGVALRLLVGPAPAGSGAHPLPAPPAGRAARVAALAVSALLVAHWSLATRGSLADGMTGYDTLWYHGPFAVDFARGSTFQFDFLAPRYLYWFLPANSELINSFGILTIGRDTLSVLINIGWLGATLLTAWAVGRPYGAAPHSVIAVALLLDSGVMADQAGSGRNDTIAIFFFLAAIAILVNAAAADGRSAGEAGSILTGARSIPTAALAAAGLAVGLMAGTKVHLLALALVMVVGIPLITRPGRRSEAAAAFAIAALAGCGYWYLRNLARVANPLPWVTSIGPISIPGPDQPLGGKPQFSVADYLGDGAVWHHWFAPKLIDALGVLWPIVAGLALVVVFACLIRGPGLLRVFGAAALALAMVWFFHGTSAEGPPGMPVGFFSSLRHLALALAVALALAPLAAGFRSPGARLALLVGMLALLPFVDASGAGWASGYLGVAILIGIATFALLVAASYWPPGLRTRPISSAAAALALVAGVAGVWALQRPYLEHRYVAADLSPPSLSAAARWARDLSDTRIATTSVRSYPLFGTDLSSHVAYLGGHHSGGGFTDIRSCERWRRALNEGRYSYAVISYERSLPGLPPFPPEARWTRTDPAAEVVLRHSPTVIFRLHGRLDPAGCPPARPHELRLLPGRHT